MAAAAGLPPVFSPERLEVHSEADLAAAVHLGRLAVQLRDLDLRRGGRVRGRHVEFEVELVFEQLVHVPALAEPVRAVLVGADSEPIAVSRFVELDVLNEGGQLLRPGGPASARQDCELCALECLLSRSAYLFQSLGPELFVSRSRPHLQTGSELTPANQVQGTPRQTGCRSLVVGGSIN